MRKNNKKNTRKVDMGRLAMNWWLIMQGGQNPNG